MNKLEFIGIQETDTKEVKLEGYINILPKEDEFRVPIEGMIKIGHLNYDFSGRISQLIEGIPPKIICYTDGIAKRKLFYNLGNDIRVTNGKLIYSGIWCYLTRENKRAIGLLQEPPDSKKVSIEFALKKGRNHLIKDISL